MKLIIDKEKYDDLFANNEAKIKQINELVSGRIMVKTDYETYFIEKDANTIILDGHIIELKDKVNFLEERIRLKTNDIKLLLSQIRDLKNRNLIQRILNI